MNTRELSAALDGLLASAKEKAEKRFQKRLNAEIRGATKQMRALFRHADIEAALRRTDREADERFFELIDHQIDAIASEAP